MHAGRQSLPDFVLNVSAVDTIVEVGSRAQPRSVTESTVPIDVISTEEVASQGETSLDYLPRTIVPSYNVNTQPIGDEAVLSRPTNLRGLAPDSHAGPGERKAPLPVGGRQVVDQRGQPRRAGPRHFHNCGDRAEASRGTARGSFRTIRLGCHRWRDDSLLKDAPSGGSLEIRSGVTGAGEGAAHAIAGNVGLPLGANGFANVSVEYGSSSPTSRWVQRNDASRLIAAGNTLVANPAQIWGSPKVDNDVRLWGDFGNALSDKVQLYGHASYASKKTTGGFYFRNPNTRDAVYSIDGGRSLLIGDALDTADAVLDGSAGCPAVPVVNDVPDAVVRERVIAEPNCFSFQELYPGGFTPQFGGTASDASLVVVCTC